MAGPLVAPKLEYLKLKEGPVSLPFPDLESRVRHPHAPWGPITKFYVRFTVHPLRQFIFQSEGRAELHPSPTFQTGLVLARAYEGNANLCIWSGQIHDALLHVAGINAEIANTVSESVHNCLVGMPKSKEIVWLEVEMGVVTPCLVDDGLGSASLGV